MMHSTGRFKRLLTAALLVTSGFAANAAMADQRDDPIKVGFVTAPDSFHPTFAMTESTRFIAGHLFMGLLKYSPDQGLVPLLAERWTQNEDATEFTFTIRDGMQWSDGTPITAESIAESFRFVARLEGNRFKKDFENAQIEALTENGREVVWFKLAEPRLNFVQSLAHKTMAVLPMHLSDEIDFSANWEKGLVPEDMVYSGPYVVEDALDDRLVLRPNPAYNLTQLGNHGIDLYWEDLSAGPLARERAVLGGVLDVAFVFGPKQYEGLTKVAGFAIDTVEPMANETYFINPRKAPLDDIEIRRAIAYAMTQSMPQGVIDNQILRPTRSLLPTALMRFAGRTQPYYFDQAPDRLVQEARAIMQSKGYSAENPLKLRISHNNPPAVHERVANVVRGQLSQIYIDAELVSMPWVEYFETIAEHGDFDVARWGMGFTSLDILEPLRTMTSDSPDNFVGFNNPEYDQIVAQAAAARRLEERQKLAQEAFAILHRNYVNLPMHMPLDGVLRRADVQIGRVTSETWPLLTDIRFSTDQV